MVANIDLAYLAGDCKKGKRLFFLEIDLYTTGQPVCQRFEDLGMDTLNRERHREDIQGRQRSMHRKLF
jgi:hypothetical protein